MGKLTSKIQAISYSLRHGRTEVSAKGEINKILIILDQGGVGDTVCSLDAFRYIAEYTRGKYELYIATQPPVIRFLQEIRATFGAQLIPLELAGEGKWEFPIFKKNSENLAGCHWRYIVYLNRIDSYVNLLLAGCDYDGMCGTEFIGKKVGFGSRLLRNRLHDYVCIDVQMDEHVAEIHAKVAEELLQALVGDDSGRKVLPYEISRLEENPLAAKKGKYCIVCPSVSVQKNNAFVHRKWPIDRFVKVVDFIEENSDLTICLCGVEADRADNEYVEKHVKDPSRIINLTGKTSFKEWIELIRGAKFVFGNDSGYIHLAAMLKVLSFVLAGYWNYGRFLPYCGWMAKGKTVPVDIRVPQPPCSNCFRLNPCGKEKRECDRCVKEIGVYKCILEIGVEQVNRALIENHMVEGKKVAE